MNIIEVMNSLQINVGFAKRPSWVNGEILVRSNISNIEIVNIDKNFNDELHPNYTIYEFTCEDLSADDWIIMGENV